MRLLFKVERVMKPDPPYRPVRGAVAVDHIADNRRRYIAAGNRTGITDSTCLRIDWVALIHAGIFGEINFEHAGVGRKSDRDRVRTALDVLGVIDSAAVAGRRIQLSSNLLEGVALGIGN